MEFIRHFRGLPLGLRGQPPSPLTTKLRRNDRLGCMVVSRECGARRLHISTRMRRREPRRIGSNPALVAP